LLSSSFANPLSILLVVILEYPRGRYFLIADGTSITLLLGVHRFTFWWVISILIYWNASVVYTHINY